MNIETLRKTPPQTGQIGDLNLIEPEFFQLDNGIPVYFINAGDQEVIKIDLSFPFGSSRNTIPLSAHFTNLCLKEGTSSFDAQQIAETLDYYGANLLPFTTREDSMIHLFCMNKHLSKLLALLSELVFHPVFPQEEVRAVVKNTKQVFLVSREKVKTLVHDHFRKAVFGKHHPYGGHATAEDFDQITSEVLGDFYQKNYRTARFRIIVSGRIPDHLPPLLNKYFGRHEVIETPEMEIAKLETTDEKFLFFEKEGSLQSGIAVGKVMFNMQHPDFIRMKVVNTVLGGYFGSRLMTNIREDKGYTYGINSMLIPHRHSGILQISAEVGADVTRRAIDEVFAEMERMRRENVPQEELDLVKNYMSGSLLRQSDGAIAQGDMLKQALDHKLDLSYYSRFVETIKTMTIEEIKDLAVKYFDPASMITVAVGKNDSDGN
jgi:zinc protease